MHKDINVNVSGPVQPTSTYKTVVLKGNLPFASQVTEPNTKYVIKHNFDLSDGAIVYEGWEIEGMGGNPSIIDGEEYWLTDYESGIAEPTTYTLVDDECFFVIDNHISDTKEVTLQQEENTWIATKRRGYHARILSHYDSNAAITIPENCVLEFDGGSLSNGTIIGQNTKIHSAPVGIFEKISFAGSWNIPYITSSWLKDATTKDAIKQLINLTSSSINNTVVIEEGNYSVSVPRNTHSMHGNAAFRLKSNTKFIIDGVISLVDSPYRATVIIDTDEQENIIIEGSGTLVGNKVECAAAGIDGEFGFGINVLGKNITIRDIKIIDCWGDSIIIGEDEDHQNEMTQNVIISGITAYGSRRQGISVINGDTIDIDNCVIHDINGTSPFMAIDIEPLYQWQQTRNIRVTDCVCYNTRGIMTTTENYENDVNRISNIVIENNNIYNNINYGGLTIRFVNYAVVKNNVVKTNQRGMGCMLQGNNIVFDNNVVEVTYDGELLSEKVIVLLSNTCQNVSITNNKLVGENCYAVTGCKNLKFVRNEVVAKSFITDDSPQVAKFTNVSIKDNSITCDDFIWPYRGSFISSNTIICKAFKFIKQGVSKCINNIIDVTEETDVTDKTKGISFTEEMVVQGNTINTTKTTILIKSAVIFVGNIVKNVTMFSENSYGINNISDNTFFKGYGGSFIKLDGDYCKICNNCFVNSNSTYTPYMVESTVDVTNVIMESNIIKGSNRIASATNLSRIYGSGNLSDSLINDSFNNGITPRTFVHTGFTLVSDSGIQPTLPARVRQMIFDDYRKKPIWWDGDNWIESDKAKVGTSRHGITSNRPVGSSIYVGFVYFDTSISPARPIYASAISGDTVTWVDATGATV